MSDVFLKHSDIDLPLVSIIILSYNHSSFIIRCLTSLANQSYHNIEVIIIDDCSKDDSVKLIKEFILLRPNFKCYVNDVNIGVTKNLNKAISE